LSDPAAVTICCAALLADLGVWLPFAGGFGAAG